MRIYARYLERRDLELDAIIGRTSVDAALLKPNPHLVLRTLDALGAIADTSVLVGDSPSDVLAAHAARIATIGFANKPGKRERLADAGARAVVDDLRTLAPTARASTVSAR